MRALQRSLIACGALILPCVRALAAQDPATADILERMRVEGLERSRLEPLAFALIDSIGPRLTGSPGMARARDWIARRYREWGIDVTHEQYGTWPGWQRGTTHVDMMEPRVRTLDAHLLPFSKSLGITTGVVTFPIEIDSASVRRWLVTARGKMVLMSPELVTCRPQTARGAAEMSEGRRREDAQQRANSIWVAQIRAITTKRPDSIYAVLKRAGVAGIIQTAWSGGWGTSVVVGTPTAQLPAIGMSCEDYGLLYRLSRRGIEPMLRVDARATDLGVVPAVNTIATIPGLDLGREYVILSAHLDSWDGGAGATDNGSGTLIMMEAMRILRAAYPRPRRTILAGHWDGEEAGLNGSLAFAADHPEVTAGLHVLLNQDNGTGRIVEMSMQGFTALAPVVRRWLSAIPKSVVDSMRIDDPGGPGGGTDYASFTCHGAPAIALESAQLDYSPYTWHTTIDTQDKLSFDDLRRNATLVAMLAYLAAEEPTQLQRTRLAEGSPAGAGMKVRAGECGTPDRTGARRIR